MTRSTVAVVDYGSGNLRSVSQAVAHAAQAEDVNVVVTADAQAVRDADRVVLPGQGHMADCMRELERSGLMDAVLHAAAHKPLFGVCVGMQMLLDHSEEGPCQGLGLLPGAVLRFRLQGQTQPDGSRYKYGQTISVPSSWTYDLDTLSLSGGASADLWWHVISNNVGFLEPNATAKIRLTWSL